ncbi:MAG: tandem-95 repeat protein [Terrimonas ferruginea]|uniref:PKD domain-containing protein n=1 Tax=Terrimonas ferruginea TaxID=249 RepID=UPI001AC42D12|nr:PKD domain-containing protein [Terrimonas ferruginea]MBN8784193.1 tandem-95 repeat protein [Terrimonas ferruginea]
MCLLLAGISVTAQRQNLLLESGFEGSSYLAGWTNNQHCCNYSVQQSTEQLKAGSSALRLEVRSSDPQTSSSIRSEITRSSDPLNADRWYGFSMYLKDWANDPAGEHVFQWHPDNSSGSSALSLWTSGGRFTIVTNNTGTSSGNVYNDIGPVLSNQWVDFVIRIRWSTATTGLLQVWRNGTLVVNKENVKTAAITNSFKLGINKYGWGIQTSTTTQRILFFDEVRIGNENATYNDVAPGSGTAPVNRPPVANAGADQTTTLPANTAVLSGTGSNDPDGTITTYAWSKISGPNTGTIATANTVTTNVTGLTQGVYRFRLQVTDNSGATAADTVQVTVNAAPNQPPVVSAGADQTIALPINSVVLSGSANDPDGTITTYAWSKISGPNAGTIATANTVTTNVTGLTQGVYRFRLQVTDNSGATAADTVQVTVNAAPNQPPVANAGADQTITLPINNVVLNGSANDPDGTITTYTWSKISGPNAGTIATANAVTTNVTGLTQGVYRFRLQVTDNSGATAADTVQVTVNAAPNQPPVANAGADQTITLPINSVVLNGSANDPDGTITSYAWSKVSGPNAGTIATANAVTTNVTGLTQGVYRFRLQVTDNSGATADAIVQVTVNPAVNQPPVANAGDHQVLRLPVNYTQLDGRSSADTDGRIMSYRWAYVSGPANFILNDPAAALTSLSGLVEGVYVFRLTVTDDNGAAHADDVTITVLPPNQPPVAEAGNSIVMTLPTNATTLDGRVSYDPDGSIIRWQWTLISGPAAPVIVNPNAAVTAVNNLIQGTYSFRLTVTDDAGATDSDEVQVIVNRPANQLPIARAGNDITITLPVNQVQLDGAASYDPDGTIATFAWTRISGPADATIETPAAALTRINRLTQGTYIFRLTVTDNSGANASDDVVITVLPAPRVNQPPRAVAGADFTLSLPASAASLDGSASSDPDGQIVIHRWRQLSGPTVARITAPAAARTNVEGLLPGEYIFELTVTDNEGATASATAKINVVESILNLLVYPNPAANDLTLRYGDQVNGNVRVLIYDAEMRKVHERVVNKNQAMLQHTIDLRRLRSGTYFLRIITSDGRKIDRTFVKL